MCELDDASVDGRGWVRDGVSERGHGPHVYDGAGRAELDDDGFVLRFAGWENLQRNHVGRRGLSAREGDAAARHFEVHAVFRRAAPVQPIVDELVRRPGVRAGRRGECHGDVDRADGVIAARAGGGEAHLRHEAGDIEEQVQQVEVIHGDVGIRERAEDRIARRAGRSGDVQRRAVGDVRGPAAAGRGDVLAVDVDRDRAVGGGVVAAPGDVNSAGDGAVGADAGEVHVRHVGGVNTHRAARSGADEGEALMQDVQIEGASDSGGNVHNVFSVRRRFTGTDKIGRAVAHEVGAAALVIVHDCTGERVAVLVLHDAADGAQRGGAAGDGHAGGGDGFAALHVRHGAADEECSAARPSVAALRGEARIGMRVAPCGAAERVGVVELPVVGERVAIRVRGRSGEGLRNTGRKRERGGTDGDGRRDVAGERAVVQHDIERLRRGAAFLDRRDMDVRLVVRVGAADGERSIVERGVRIVRYARDVREATAAGRHVQQRRVAAGRRHGFAADADFEAVVRPDALRVRDARAIAEPVNAARVAHDAQRVVLPGVERRLVERVDAIRARHSGRGDVRVGQPAHLPFPIRVQIAVRHEWDGRGVLPAHQVVNVAVGVGEERSALDRRIVSAARNAVRVLKTKVVTKLMRQREARRAEDAFAVRTARGERALAGDEAAEEEVEVVVVRVV